jgi:hypothetical protein
MILRAMGFDLSKLHRLTYVKYAMYLRCHQASGEEAMLAPDGGRARVHRDVERGER